MFEQFIGDGADVFITITAIVIGLAVALGFMDFKKTKEEENEPH